MSMHPLCFIFSSRKNAVYLKTSFCRTMRNSTVVRRVLLHEICANIMLACLVFMVVLVGVLFTVSRAYIFQHELNVLKTERKNEKWLLRQCEDDTFYHEMKHHSTLCDEVNVNSQDDIYLLALGRVSQKTYLCGDTPCIELFEHIVEWLAGQGFIVMCSFCFLCLTMPSIALTIWNLIGRQLSAFRHREPNTHHYENLFVSGFENCKKTV